MLETIKTLLLDFLESTLDTGVPRRTKVAPVRNKVAICIGVRRCGKSTYLFQIIQGLIDAGVPRENILYLNFFDDRLHGLTQAGIGLITEAYFALYPEKKNTETVYCFFDEIQDVPGWESFVDRLLRTERCEIYLTGSSARMLSREIATQMRGRALPFEMFPFSFREFLDRRGIEGSGNLSTRRRLIVRKAFDEFWACGGFPEVFGLDANLRVRIHQEYLRTILFRDVIERHDVSHPRAVTDLALRLVDNAASLYTVNSLTGYLQSLGHKAPKASISDYLEWFEDSYFLFTVRLHDASLARANANPKKIYAADHAFVASVSSGVLVNSGHLLENLVFNGLRRAHPTIRYYRTRSGKEVDFIVPRAGDKPMLVQVCETLADPRARKRETTALTEAMSETGQVAGIIVTRDEREMIETAGGAIDVVPAWRFLLDLD